MYTVDQVKEWTEENNAELDEGRLSCDDADVQIFNRCVPEKSKELWDVGCWLSEQLAELGATEAENHDICFAHGQRSFAGNTIQSAVDYANEFLNNKSVKDKLGIELADEINKEVFGE